MSTLCDIAGFRICTFLRAGHGLRLLDYAELPDSVFWVQAGRGKTEQTRAAHTGPVVGCKSWGRDPGLSCYSLHILTWDGPQKDLWLSKLGFLTGIDDITHHGKFTTPTKLKKKKAHKQVDFIRGAQEENHSTCLENFSKTMKQSQITANVNLAEQN